MTENRLKYETSPYLLQHKDNPVHWWAWGPEALAEAKRANKPILLSVGYAACHWCHVMAHESFEDEATANVMNELFVNIKVDREERPDIDAIYMGALHRLGEQGGWPLTMFLDSDARPFWGGTYFPKEARFGRPAFVHVLLRIAEAYQNQPENVASNASKIVDSLGTHAAAVDRPVINDALTKELVRRIAHAVDPAHGGLSGAPKFPQWNVFWLLWRGAMRFGDDDAKAGVIRTLRNICQGGIYDHLGGGFARYSVDEFWLVPHFEKMLYDNALLIDLMTEVWRETQEPLFATRIAETVAWLERDMIADGGGFAASLDADSEGEEGRFYVWSEAEIVEVLGAEDAALFSKVYGVTPGGNFEGHTILNRLDSMQPLADADEKLLSEMRCRLFARRATRIRPGWDDKVLADWNGLMIAALARASVMFDKPEWRTRAERAFAFVTTHMSAGGDRLWHSYRAGRASAPASASDYANMIFAALRLYETTLDAAYLAHAETWSEVLERHYADVEAGGYFTAADDTRDVIVRLKPASDDAVPSANAIQLSNLLTLSALTGRTEFSSRASVLLTAFGGAVAQNPIGHCGLMAAALDADALAQIVTIERSRGGGLADAVNRVSVPGSLLIHVSGHPPDLLPEGLRTKLGIGSESKAYVCRGSACLSPVSDPAELRNALRQIRT